MKILIVIPDLVLGGVTTVVKNLVAEIDKSKYKVLIITLKFTEIQELDGCEVKCLNVTNRLSYLLSIIKLSSMIRNFQPEVIHSHTIYPHLIIRFAKILNLHNIAHVCSEHNTISSRDTHFIWNIFKFTDKYSDVITFVSKYSADSYLKKRLVSSNKVKLLYNGIDCESFKNNKFIKEGNFFYFAYIGRLSKEKNLFNLLKAIKLVAKKINNFKLYIVGDGDERGGLEKFVRDNNLMNNVEFLGHKNNIKPIIKEIDLLILSSDTEGLPMVILEGMAMQCNIVSTKCGGVPEIFTDIPKFLAEINNPEDLADKILENVNLSKEEREKIGILYEKQIFDKFSIGKYMSELEKIYKGLVV